jgi:hypothetical protein
MGSNENELCPKSMIDESQLIKSSRLCKVCGNKGAQMYSGQSKSSGVVS